MRNGASVLRTSQTYNANNQLTGQAWQMGSTAYSETYTYNSTDGSLNKMTTGAGTTLTMGYDALRRLTSVTGGPVSRQYTYRDIDNGKTTSIRGIATPVCALVRNDGEFEGSQ